MAETGVEDRIQRLFTCGERPVSSLALSGWSVSSLALSPRLCQCHTCFGRAASGASRSFWSHPQHHTAPPQHWSSPSPHCILPLLQPLLYNALNIKEQSWEQRGHARCCTAKTNNNDDKQRWRRPTTMTTTKNDDDDEQRQRQTMTTTTNNDNE